MFYSGLGRENLTMNDFMQGVDIIVTTPTKKPAGDGHSNAHSRYETTVSSAREIYP